MGIIMAEYKHSFVNVTVLGRMNPQILTHDWLVKNKIITWRDFVTRDKTKVPFSTYFNTPPMTQLAYGPLIFTIEESKFVLSDSKAGIEKSKIYRMADKYFDLLPHTPLTKVGFNVQGILTFKNTKEMKEFDSKYINCGEALKQMAIGKGERISFAVSTKEGKAVYRLTCTKHPEEPKAILGGNCEFDIKDSAGLLEILSDSVKYVEELGQQQREIAKI